MKRRFLLVGLAVPVVASGWWASMAASWRPVALARFDTKSVSATYSTEASGRLVLQRVGGQSLVYVTYATRCLLVNTRTQSQQEFRFKTEEYSGVQNGFFWHCLTGFNATISKEHFSLEVLDEKGKQKHFALPSAWSSSKDFRKDVDIYVEDSESLRILPEQNRIVFLRWSGIYEWNWGNQKFKRLTAVKDADETEGNVLSRDGKTFLFATKTHFLKGITSTGLIVAKTFFPSGRFSQQIRFSPYGRYALLDQPSEGTAYEVVETSTGKRLWGFKGLLTDRWTISDDEQTIFVGQGKQWEVRDLKTGTLLRRLQRVPDTSIAASSPDGGALYFASHGVLYRQRAR